MIMMIIINVFNIITPQAAIQQQLVHLLVTITITFIIVIIVIVTIAIIIITNSSSSSSSIMCDAATGKVQQGDTQQPPQLFDV